MRWQIRERVLELDRPMIMGILNCTPDSFSDGGRFFSPDAAGDRALQMIAEGADIIDVGGESSRPGAKPVPAQEEMERVLPVITALARARGDVPISIDTVKGEVAREAIAAGAHIVNDVSGLRLDPAIASVCRDTGAGVVLMHSRGGVADMASFDHARYANVADEMLSELRVGVARARGAGLSDGQMVLDPGIGFSKTADQSLAALAALPRLAALGFPVLVGVSRKRFIGEITGVAEPAARLHGTLGAAVAALALGARIFRMHDVAPAREALDVAWRIIQ